MMDWQEVWQDLEDAYDAVRERKTGATEGLGLRDDVILDYILTLFDLAQSVCERMGAVPVEPVE
jgi:hypothetical protein